MGLLDALFPGGGSGGGLLDFLKNNALNQQFPGMPQGDAAQYGQMPMGAQAPIMAQQNAQPSPLDTAQWPAGPVGAPAQANAQMPPQQPPPVIQAQPMQGQPAPGEQAPPQENSFLRGLQSVAHGGGIISALSGHYNDPQSVQDRASNLTAKALLAKGVDPIAVQAAIANPELLKTLITQTYGPQTVQSLGNGYVADKSGNIKRAYEPEDKIPSGFTKDDQGNMKFIPGGPADPAYQRLLAAKAADPNAVFVLGKGGELYKKDAQGNVTIVHKNESDAGKPMLSDEGQDLMAERIINGEKGVTTGFARSKEDMAGIYNKVAEKAKARGIDASDILSNINNEYAAASASRSFGGMTAKQETYSNTAAKAIDIAEKASEAVPRTSWVPINKAILAYKEKTGDPAVAALGQSLETLTQEYARAVGGGHGTVSDKEEAREYLAKAQTHEQLVARFNIMRQEIARGRESVGESAAHVGGIYRNNIRRGSALPEPGTKDADALMNAPKAATGLPDGWSVKVH